MRTFVQKPKPTQTKYASSTRPAWAFSGQNRDVRSILHLHRTIGNQAVKKLPLRKEGDIEKSAFIGESSCFVHNFTHIPVHTTRSGTAPTEGTADGLPLPSGIRARFESGLHADFSQVRLFPHRPDVTGPLHARAVTRGQDIYFHPEQFRPGTFGGDTLIAHELAHTLQVRAANHSLGARRGLCSQPGDSLERNADAIARGEVVSVLPAPEGMALRSPFDTETEQDRTRRERLVHSIGNAIETILRVLRTGGLVQGSEVANERNGVRGVIYYAGSGNEIFESYAERDARLRRIVRSLMAMARQYRSAPIPAEFTPPVPQPAESGGRYESSPFTRSEAGQTVTSTFGGATAAWADLQSAYERYRVSQGQIGEAFEHDWLFLDPDLRMVPGALRGAPRIRRGIPTGAYMVVPDIERDPLRYWQLSGFERHPPGSVIVELWHDDFGYYYMHRSQRIDVPSPWSR